MERVGKSDTTSRSRVSILETSDEITHRAGVAARELLALAPSPAQRGTIALLALAAIERELARAVRS